MSEMEIRIEGCERKVKTGSRLLELARAGQENYPADIVLAIVDGKLQELYHTLERPASIRFVTTADSAGRRAYERSVQMLMNKAIRDVASPEKVRRVVSEFSVPNGLYIEASGDFILDEAFLSAVEERMRELVREDIPIVKDSLATDEAIRLFAEMRMVDKEKLFGYRRSSMVNIYRLDDFIDYYYGYMVPSTGYLKAFGLALYQKGFVLLLPDRKQPEQTAEFHPQDKLFHVMEDATEWGYRMHLGTVADVNAMIAGGQAEEMILVAEARQEKQIADIAARIAAEPDKKIVLIAGPSSSGKTSFSHRLSVQLMALGLTPHPIAVDDYFVDREFTPRDENGDLDYEALECVDVRQFNLDMSSLLAGETVELPSFDFQKGKRVYRGNFLKLGANDILVIEGIHCLNDRLTFSLPPKNRFKIYISALTQLNIDDHNRIPTTDGRLIRRMIRDARTRGASARDTLARWPSVRRGEAKNIFPFQETADVMFDSSLIYEFAVMKTYAEQLLFGIPQDAPEYLEAKRLLKFFDYILGVDSNKIPQNSLLKEFIGGSIFRV